MIKKIKIKLNFDKMSSYKYDIRTLTKEKIKSMLLLPLKMRTISEKTMLIFFILNVSKLPKKFITEHIDEASYINIIQLSESTLSYKLMALKDSLIYDYNDMANYFYIILCGSAKLIRTEKYVEDMDAHNYFLLLMKYKKENEICLLEKTIKENYNIFPIDKRDIRNLEYIYLKILIIRKEERHTDEYIEELVKKVGLKMKDFGLLSYKEEIEEENKKISFENKILYIQRKYNQMKEMVQYSLEKAREKDKKDKDKIRDILGSISPETCIQYSFMTKDDILPVCFYNFVEYKNIASNDYFGDFENNKYIHRVISTSNELELLLMRNDIYKEFMKNERHKIKAEQINFLTQNFFFNSIDKIIFTKIYYNLFDFECYNINEIIIKENNKVDYLYFIKNGKVKLTSNKSAIENHLIINLIYNIFMKQNKNNKYNDIKEKYLKLYSSNNIENFEKMEKKMNSNRENNLMICQENQCIGHECFFYGFSYLYTATAKSDKVEVYKIRVDKLMKILKDKTNDIYLSFVKKSTESLALLFNLIININSNLVHNYNVQTQNKIKILEAKKENENKISFKDKSNINEIINRDKIIISRNNKVELKLKSINSERKFNSIINDDIIKKYTPLPILKKFYNFRNIKFNLNDEINERNNNSKCNNLKQLSMIQNKNKRLYISNSYRSNYSSNNISEINEDFTTKNINISPTKIIKYNNEIKSNNNLHNSMLKKLKKENKTSINFFSLRKRNDIKNININMENNNIITFDFQIQQQYQHPNSVKNRNYKSINFDIYNKNNSSQRNKHKKFKNYNKFYLSDINFDKNKIRRNFIYNNKKSMITNMKLLKYGVYDLLRPMKKENFEFKLNSPNNYNRRNQNKISIEKYKLINSNQSNNNIHKTVKDEKK